MTQFEGVLPALAKALEKRGYETLTPVQTAMMAPELEGRDVLVSAKTGSGKTVAFGMAMAGDLLEGENRFKPAQSPLALVIAPTRELALQVRKELEWLYGETGASIASCVGGMDIRAERRALSSGAHLVVGTPGRLVDHIKRGSLELSNLKAVVLDEADEMLDLGFREDLEFILEASPAERRTLMFSATVPRSIASLAKRYQRDAVRVSTQSEERQHADIEYRAMLVSGSDRENAIINVLRYYEARNALVFCGTRAMVSHMTARFSNRGFSVVALSGELSQSERSHALQALRDGRAKVCIATDVAARGIDLPNLELVIHADLPKTSETLLHRSGRTGRAGRKGVCAIIVPHSQRRKAERLLQNASITAEWARPPTADDVIRRDDERLMADPALNEPATSSEEDQVAKLKEGFSPEQLAAAVLRLYRKDRSAPEEIDDKSPIFETRTPKGRERKAKGERPFEDRGQGQQAAGQRERKGKDRNDFENGVWFTLSVGRKHKAEPKWLIPMLCRAGDFTKQQIGAIRIDEDQTRVEIDPAHAERFISGLGKNGMLEKSIAVRPMADEGQEREIAAPMSPFPDEGGHDLPAKRFQKKSGSGKTERKAGWAKPGKKSKSGSPSKGSKLDGSQPLKRKKKKPAKRPG